MEYRGNLSLRTLFLRHVAQTSPSPAMLEVEKAEGIYITDIYGKKYIDFISGISVSNVGHCHPQVVKAIREQTDRYMHVMVYGEFIQSPQVRLAQRLSELLPDPLRSVYFVNSGAEATEGAMKLAKRVTGRREMLSFRNAYHGSTQGALSMMGSGFFKEGYGPLLPGTALLEYNQYDDLQQINESTACVIAETIQGEAGAIVPDPLWIRALRKRCTETGALLILDEIQCGFGRTGSFFAFEQYGIVPDILLLAKGMGGGLPVGAFISSRENMQQLTHRPVLGHITTFGGNAVCCAASLAVTEVLLHEQIPLKVAVKEQLIRELIRHPAIRSVRGKGLLLAAEFESNAMALRVMEHCMERGLITDWFLFAGHCLRIAPPLTITDDELREACHIFMEAVEAAVQC